MTVYNIVKDTRTLRAMQRRGFIAEARHGFYPCCDEGLKYTHGFKYKNNQYCLSYFSGSFNPYVVKLD